MLPNLGLQSRRAAGRFACGIFKYYLHLERILFPNRVHTRLVVEPVETQPPLPQTVERRESHLSSSIRSKTHCNQLVAARM